jgi:hypothetical protein
LNQVEGFEVIESERWSSWAIDYLSLLLLAVVS